MPLSAVKIGDAKEFNGLFKDGVLVPCPAGPPPSSRFIGSRLVRRIKGEGVKSRYVLQDCKHNRPADGGVRFAATPSFLSVRTALTLSSRGMAAGKKQLLIFGDVAQAFSHSPLDRPVWTRLPSDCEGLETVIDGETVTVHGSDAVVVA